MFTRIFRAFSYFFNALFFEWPKGVDFSIRDKYSNKDSALNGYARTSKNSLKNLYRIVDIKGKSFLDIGSGKGGVIYDTYCLGAMVSHGIEYNLKLHLLALNNLNRLKCNDNCTSINIDARLFQNYSNYNVYFLFNPFNEIVYVEVMNQIKKQILNDLKERWIIAYGQSFDHAITKIDNAILIANGICPFRKTTYSIYKIN